MNKKYIAFFGYLIFIMSISTFLYFVSPDEIVTNIGISNSYILVFLISLFGGFSSWTSFSMIAIMVTLVTGGVSLLTIGIIAGIGLSIGDFVMFFTSRKGRELITGKYDKFLLKCSTFLEKHLHGFIPFITYIYMGLTPLPNDMLLVSLGLIKYPEKKIYLPILLADMTYPILATIIIIFGF